MHNSDDDVVIIDSSTASDATYPQAEEEEEAGEYSFSRSSAQYSDGEPQGAPPQPSRHTTAHDADCQRLHAALHALSSSAKAEAEVQTDAVPAADSADVLRRHLHDLNTALGIDVKLSARKDGGQQHREVAERLAASWRAAARSAKRPRREANAVDDCASADSGPGKYVKQEGISSPTTNPAWWTSLQAAIEETQRLLQFAADREAVGHNAADEARRAALVSSFPHSRGVLLPPLSSPFSDVQTVAGTAGAAPLPAVPPQPSARNAAAPKASASPLLREAEVMCAREGTTSLLPLYAELHTLRRQHAQAQRTEAQQVAQKLQWEQRLLTDVLTECEAQLDVLDGNFIDACRSGLAPLDALQQRMEVLQRFQRQLRSAEKATAPLPEFAARGREEGTAVAAAATEKMEGRLPRAVGHAAGAFAHHFDEERRALEAQVCALRAALEEQQRRHAELQACYAHATAQAQHTLDAADYISKDAITGLRQQHREDAAALARQFGWTLLNATPDVLSLRHPLTKEVLHVNHQYGTINGKPCGDVAQTLADYLLKHASPAPVAASAVVSAEAPLAPLSSSDSDGTASEVGGRASPLPAPEPAADGVALADPRSAAASTEGTPSTSSAMEEAEAEEGEAERHSTEPRGSAETSSNGQDSLSRSDSSEHNEEREEEQASESRENTEADEAADSQVEEESVEEEDEEATASPSQIPVVEEPEEQPQEAKPNLYTGFFSEGALWDDES